MIVVVTGLPRSGTSLMMQMLAAGGFPILTDGVRGADEDNPRGYFEFELVKRLPVDASWLAQAEGRALKVIHALTKYLPPGYEYRTIVMRRAIEEVLASQSQMLNRAGKASAGDEKKLAAAFEAQMTETVESMRRQPNFRVLQMPYKNLLDAPLREAERVIDFLSVSLNGNAMASVVDPSLYRQRSRLPAE
jgi:hypothetical protein